MRFDNERLNGDEVRQLLLGRPTYSFDPATRKRVAVVTYDPRGTCRFELEDGGGDAGEWGLEGDTYWTRYGSFRGGVRNVFYLIWVSPGVAQAYHEDGTPAFLQSKSDDLDRASSERT